MTAEPRFLLDANICIYVLIGGIPGLEARISEAAAGELAMSSIALGEVLVKIGAHELNRLDLLLREVAVLPFDSAAAIRYAQLPFKRRSFDRLIAGHALALGLTVVTANADDFADVPGLQVEDWTR